MNSIKYLLMAGGFLMSSENTASIQAEYQYDNQGRPIIPPQEELINISKDGGELWNRLVFESSPYLPTCHWCHVMEHESFENDEVAGLMNDAFVCIKVDREEHP